MMAISGKELRLLADNKVVLYEVARLAIEDALVELRDKRIFILGRNNGCVIKERNGTESSVIRLPLESAMAIGLKAIAKYIDDGGAL